MGTDIILQKATGKNTPTPSGGAALSLIASSVLQPISSGSCSGVGGLTSLLVEVKNLSAETALGDFQLSLYPHPESSSYPLVTGTAWASVAGVLKAKSASINTLAAASGGMAYLDIGPAYAFELYAKTAGTTILTNGTFTSNANNWTLGSGWAYSSNTVVATTASTTLKQTKANMGTAWTNGQYYRVGFTITGYSVGSLTVGTNTDPVSSANTPVTANGTYEWLVLADNHADGLVFTGTGFSGTIDSVSAVAAPLVSAKWSAYR